MMLRGILVGNSQRSCRPRPVPLIPVCFVAWAFLSGLAGEMLTVNFPEEIPKLRSRSVTPGRFLLQSCDGKFTDDDLNDEGNAFVRSYFDFKNGAFLRNSEATLGRNVAGLYYMYEVELISPKQREQIIENIVAALEAMEIPCEVIQ
jgi:hypothetical protein